MATKRPPTPPLFEVASLTPDDPGAGFVGELRESTDEVLKTHGAGSLDLYEKLHRDYQVYATFQQRRGAVVAREIRVEAASDAPLDVLAADSLRAQIAAVSFDRVSRRMLNALINGYAVSECMFGVDPEKGSVRLDSIRVRRASRFRFGSDGRLRLMRGGEPMPMPERKFWTFACGSEDDDDPYGRGLGHWLYWPVWFKRNAFRYWALFLERFASPTPYATVPTGTGLPDLKKVTALLEHISNGGKVAIPGNVKIEFLNAMRDSGGDYEKFIRLQDASISKIVVSQTMTTDEGGSSLGGSQGQTHENVGITVAKDDAALLCESFRAGPATWLTEWNFPGARVPLVYRDFSEAADRAALAETDSKLFVIGYRPTPERVQETFGDGYEPVPAPPAPPGASFAEAKVLGGAEAVAELVGDDGWRRVMGPEVDAIERMLDGSRSLEDVRRRIGQLADRDPGALVDAMSRVMFSARVAGESEVPGELEDDDSEFG